ncbi:MAG TPA: O-antigen ligase family protein [Caulobacteraceae bacterium]|jgi:O-antigen ligase|nr:O-antigen ligase family protein [Caulobacteraceae bacterium]
MSAAFPAPAAFAPPRRGLAGALAGGEYAAAVAVLLLMSGALLAPLFSPDQNPDSVPWLRTMWLPVYGVVGLLLLRDPARASRVWIGGALSLVLVAWAFASSRWSIDADVTTRRSVALMFTTLFGLHLASAYDWRRFIELTATVFLVLAAGTYISCLLFPAFGHQDKVHPSAWSGLWYEKNQLGWLMTHGCLACACAALFSPERRRLWIAGTVLCLGAVVMSRSTTSLLGVTICLGGIMGLGLVRRGRAVALVAVWAALALGGAFVGVLVFAPELFFNLVGKEPSLTGRTDIWAAVLRQAAGRPWLGYGFGAFWIDPWGPAWFIRHDLKWNVPHAHDGWLEMLVEIGVIGMGLAALHFVISAVAAVFTLRRGLECYWAIPFMAIFALFSISESTVMQYNGLTWTLYIATMAKLFEGRAWPSGPAAPRPVKLFPDE